MKRQKVRKPKWMGQGASVGLSMGLFLLIWQGVIWLGEYPTFILPSPSAVCERWGDLIANGALWLHTAVTLREVLLGLGLGALTAIVLGYLLVHSPPAERLLTPYIVASQSVPTVAVAPLLVIWFGTGTFSKVLVCALIVFFPILMNTMVGVRSVSRDLRDLMRTLEANRWQMLWLLEVPASLPVLLSGLKMGATLSVIGAVVGEFVASDRGLGYLLKQGQQLYDTPLVFVGIGTLVILAQSLYGIVALGEYALSRWQRAV
ncbi:MAG TPA: ABC transporter permease [Chloroflexi bacterium]|nr:ABC transporter permease [Chloroflexota bacterium]